MQTIPETEAKSFPAWAERPGFPSVTPVPYVSDQAEAYAEHPSLAAATADLAHSLNSVATGLSPLNWSGWLPGQLPSRPIRTPSHNGRVAGFLAYQQAQRTAQGQRTSTQAEPQRFACRSILGVRRAAHLLDPAGYAINLEYAYRSPSGHTYVVTGAAFGFADGPLTGTGYARSCSCPDFQKRRGPARDQLAPEARCCKHLRLFLAVVHLWQGQLPWVGGLPALQKVPGDQSFTLREF